MKEEDLRRTGDVCGREAGDVEWKSVKILVIYFVCLVGTIL